MKKHIKIALFVILSLALAICFLLWSFSLSKYETPLNYPDTKWISEDGTICFEVFAPVDKTHGYGEAYGTMALEDGTVIDIMLGVLHPDTLCVQDPTNERIYEVWDLKKFSKDRYTIVVKMFDNRYPLHEKNTRIVFNRIDDN